MGASRCLRMKCSSTQVFSSTVVDRHRKILPSICRGGSGIELLRPAGSSQTRLRRSSRAPYPKRQGKNDLHVSEVETLRGNTTQKVFASSRAICIFLLSNGRDTQRPRPHGRGQLSQARHEHRRLRRSLAGRAFKDLLNDAGGQGESVTIRAGTLPSSRGPSLDLLTGCGKVPQEFGPSRALSSSRLASTGLRWPCNLRS